VIPVLTPDRPEKRQNGRRFKEIGEPSFTLTGQDVHGVMILKELTKDQSQGYRVYDPDGISTTLAGEGGGVGAKTGLYKQQNMIRRLTPLECERLQGFPDGWTEGISDTQRYKCLGNAVTVNVVEEIVKRF